MIADIRAAIDDVIQSKFRDRRLCHAALEPVQVEDSRVGLSGTVLDEQTRDGLAGALGERFPDLSFDMTQVEVLRRRPPRLVTVATNVTGLRGRPSSGSELQSELLGGWQLEWLQERDNWVFVRQPDGYLGWVYAPYLTDEQAAAPTDMIVEPITLLRESPAPDAPIVTRLPAGMAVPVAETFEEEWARVELPGLPGGWLPRTALRPLRSLPADEAGRREQMVEDAFPFVGVPYRWGGVTALGLDCSGFVQLLHRLAGVTIPRDADMQMAAGRPVEPPLQPGDLLFFGGEGDHRRISHVGMSLGGWLMIHSSGSRNGVYLDDLEEAARLRTIYVGAATYVGN